MTLPYTREADTHMYYQITEELKTTEEKDYISYGVAVFDENDEIKAVVCDITPTYETAVRFLKLCEKNKISPLHLKDAAEDYIISERYFSP